MLVSIILLIVYYVLQRQIRIRAKKEEELEVSREWFPKTLASIGEAVVATDDYFKITYMNAATEKLTGWSVESARGRSVYRGSLSMNLQTLKVPYGG